MKSNHRSIDLHIDRDAMPSLGWRSLEGSSHIRGGFHEIGSWSFAFNDSFDSKHRGGFCIRVPGSS
jgi:hypothetical protein